MNKIGEIVPCPDCSGRGYYYEDRAVCFDEQETVVIKCESCVGKGMRDWTTTDRDTLEDHLENML